MIYSVEVYFDPDTEHELMKQSPTTGNFPFPSQHMTWSTRPHIKLGLYHNLNVASYERKLKQILQTSPRFPLTLYTTQGVSNKSTIYLSPCTNKNLYHLQQHLYSLFITCNAFQKDSFEPECWQPHCTISYPDEYQCPDHLLFSLEDRNYYKKIKGHCVEVGISEVTFPSKQLYSFPLH